MSSAAQISCVLVVVTLIICSATTLAAPKSTPAVVALDTKHLSHAPVVIKRRLRLLKLEKIGEELFESPRLFMWLVFVGARYEAGDNEAYKLAKKAAKKLADAAAEKPADAAAKKLADEAAKEAKDAFESANMASLEAALSTLRRHYEDDMLWKILAKGSEVNGQEVNIIAVELEEMLLRKLTTGRYKQSFHAFGA
ncbi:unnamed protein product [Peronospora effusa]|nr:unnamed protein product [Peronospora effusa]